MFVGIIICAVGGLLALTLMSELFIGFILFIFAIKAIQAVTIGFKKTSTTP